MEINLRSVERKMLLGLVILTLTFWLIWQNRSICFGFAVGAAISWVNFRLLRLIIEGAFQKKGARRIILIVFYPIKYLAFLAIVFFLIRQGSFHIVAFLTGLSMLLVGLLAEVIHASLRSNLTDHTMEKTPPQMKDDPKIKIEDLAFRK